MVPVTALIKQHPNSTGSASASHRIASIIALKEHLFIVSPPFYGLYRQKTLYIMACTHNIKRLFCIVKRFIGNLWFLFSQYCILWAIPLF